MAETDSQSSQTQQTPQTQVADTGQQTQQQAGARPDYIPEKFWDPEKAAPRVEDLAKSYATLESGRGKLKETLTAEITADLRKGAPAKVEDYKIALPDGTADVVLLDKPPGDDFKPEAGKTYAMLKPDSALLKSATALAHKYGVPQAEFSGIVAELAREIGFRPPTEDQVKEMRQGVYSQLGEQGAARVDHAWKGLQAAIGDKAKALDDALSSAPAVEAIEALLEKTGQGKFSPGVDGGGAGITREELLALMDSPDYATDREKQRRVNEGYAKLYPGSRTLANPQAGGLRR